MYGKKVTIVLGTFLGAHTVQTVSKYIWMRRWPHCRLVLVRSRNQELFYYKFYKNSIVFYTIVAVDETLNLALDTTFPLSYL